MNQEKRKKIVVLTVNPFPNGNVGTIRYSSYLKSMARAGYSSYVVLYSPSSIKNNTCRRGNEDGVEYRYATKISWKSGNIFEKVFYCTVGLISSVIILKKISPDVIILYGDNHYLVTLFFSLYSKCTKVRFVGDRSELPSVNIRKSKLKSIIYNGKQKMFDGMIVMTKRIKEYYKSIGMTEDRLFFLPMSIDINRFSNVIVNRMPYIAVVFGTHNRDGLEDSIKSYIKYVKEYDGIFDLRIIGNYAKMPNKDALDELISSSGISSRIIINGVAPMSDMPSLLANASCLLTTPREYISGGFPTKLGEYMLSGTPIVATIAGEVLDYIEPDIDMLMCFPNEMDKIPSYLKFVETHPNEGRILAKNSKEKAIRSFNTSYYLEDMIRWSTGL